MRGGRLWPRLEGEGGSAGTLDLQLPGEADRSPARVLALVEAVSVFADVRAVELQVSGASLARPVLRRIEQGLPHPLRAVLGADGQILHPATRPEADGVHVEVRRAEAEELRAVLGNQHGRLLVRDGVCDRGARPFGVPARRHRSGRREEPLVHAEYALDLARDRFSHLRHGAEAIRATPGASLQIAFRE